MTLFPARYWDQLDVVVLRHDFAQQLDQALHAPLIVATPQFEKKRSELVAVGAERFPGKRVFTAHALDRKTLMK